MLLPRGRANIIRVLLARLGPGGGGGGNVRVLLAGAGLRCDIGCLLRAGAQVNVRRAQPLARRGHRLLRRRRKCVIVVIIVIVRRPRPTGGVDEAL